MVLTRYFRSYKSANRNFFSPDFDECCGANHCNEAAALRCDRATRVWNLLCILEVRNLGYVTPLFEVTSKRRTVYTLVVPSFLPNTHGPGYIIFCSVSIPARIRTF